MAKGISHQLDKYIKFEIVKNLSLGDSLIKNMLIIRKFV